RRHGQKAEYSRDQRYRINFKLRRKAGIMNRKLKILVSGGGTGGHIFPAIAIADELRKRSPDAEFLFIGANGKMEMEKVPQAGYRILGINISGFDRGNLLKNVTLPFKIVSALGKMRHIIMVFKP